MDKTFSKENVNVLLEDIPAKVAGSDPDSDLGPEEIVEYEEVEEVEELPASSAAWSYQLNEEDDDIDIEYTGTPV